MKGSVRLTAVIFAAATVMGTAEAAEAMSFFNFTFDNENGSVAGTVEGTIELPDGDGTFAASSVLVTSAPTALGYTLPVELVSSNFSGNTNNTNSFTVLGGEITDLNFAGANITEGLFLSWDGLGGLTFLNTVGAGGFGNGVTDLDGSTLTFTAANTQPVPTPAAVLPGLLGMGFSAIRKRNLAQSEEA